MKHYKKESAYILDFTFKNDHLRKKFDVCNLN